MAYPHTEDILGQLPILKSYTHILLCFALSDPSQTPSILAALEHAAHQVLTLFPFLAGQVINEGASATSSGTFKVSRHVEWESPERQIVRVADHSHRTTMPPYSTLLAAHAPTGMLPGPLLSPPRPAFPQPYPDNNNTPAPVLDMQANILSGGLILALAAQHNIIDASGIFQIASLLARTMQGTPIPAAEILEGNIDRRTLIPLLPADSPLPEDHSELIPAIPLTLPPPAFFAPYQWRYFRFSPAAVRSIHALASPTPAGPPPPETPSITPNDALTAFIWQRLSTIRLRRPSHPDPPPPSTPTKLTRALDLRRTLNLTPAYMGHMIRTSHLRLPLSTVATLPLPELAARLRAQIHSLRSLDSVRSYASFLARQPDKRKIAYGGGFNPRTDFNCSSVAHVKMPVFGDLGMPELVRRPEFEGGKVPGGCYLAPMLGEMTTLPPIEIAIIGNGIIGTILALGLLNLPPSPSSIPLSIKIYEQSPEHRNIGAGIAFTMAARKCMELMDPRIAACPSHPDHSVRPEYEYDASKQDISVHGKVYKLYFLAEVMKLVPEGVVEFGRRVETVEDSGDGSGRVRVGFVGGEGVECDVGMYFPPPLRANRTVIACDGIKSRIRQVLFSSVYNAQYTHQLAFRGLVPMDRAIEKLGRHRALKQHMHLGPHAHVLHFPVAKQQLMNWAWASSSMTAPASKGEVVEAFRAWGPFEMDKWAVFDTYDCPVPAYAQGKVALAGDAAHASSPHHGAGAGIGVEDALALVAVMAKVRGDAGQGVARGKALEMALQAYSAVRYERSQWLVRSSREVRRVYEWEAPDIGPDMDRAVWYFDVDAMVVEVEEEYRRLMQ
ncbi:FAD/NAD(P)-binding domain-containing protein [Aspergillus heteromorphus CBS 117.55]|uniref:FAD/NAD(P)-binding domain-containing protein n=1 Tax=Aspergillus heteromorphus CBS 117.55 TaxID=1448321 RepID=A0A317VUK1_9EURO|nr:FAD/NAD(P)-binding domain-containing protein [Aspergillus heteromorphus CBS 117.55]PWY77011.1 FAD/NAD(P)-binding domain-containing protein [Aspergillus heteromorphus CBS 117.55]